MPYVAKIDIAYLCTRFDDFRFTRSSDTIRESINETLGVSHFKVVMGRNPANPEKLLKDTWTGDN